MVLILVGNPENVAHVWRKIGLAGKKKKSDLWLKSNQMPWTDKK